LTPPLVNRMRSEKVSSVPPRATEVITGPSRLQRNRPLKWFSGRGSAFVAPSVRIFYSTRIRANLEVA
jgi:hypothetical protein